MEIALPGAWGVSPIAKMRPLERRMMKSKQQIRKRRRATNWWTAGAMGAELLLASVLAGSVAHAVTAADPRGLCPAAASTELKAEQADCADQLDGREQICGELGGGKFNPVINPAITRWSLVSHETPEALSRAICWTVFVSERHATPPRKDGCLVTPRPPELGCSFRFRGEYRPVRATRGRHLGSNTDRR